MMKINVMNFLFQSKNHLNLILILLFNSIIYINNANNNNGDGIKGPYPNTLLLKNGRLFLSNANGLFICDVDLTINYTYTAYKNNFNNFKDISTKIEIVQFSEENNLILCLVYKILYFFDSEGRLLFYDNIFESNEFNDSYFNLIPYKKDQDYYYFIITFISSENLNILYFKTIGTNNVKISETIFNPFYFEYPDIKVNSNALGCDVMNSTEEGKVLTCCFNTKDGSFIIVQSFKLENNKFEEMGVNKYVKVPSLQSDVIHSISSEDKKKLLTFYHQDDKGYYFIFDIDTNSIVSDSPIMANCKDNKAGGGGNGNSNGNNGNGNNGNSNNGNGNNGNGNNGNNVND